MAEVILKGGYLIDPAQGYDGHFDIAISNGRIEAITAPGAAGTATTVIDVSGKLVTPGLIDTHGHVFEFVTGRFGLDADLAGVHSGVTTLIDQGGPSCMTLPAFREHVVKAKKTRVFAYLSAYLVGGLEGHFYPSLYTPECVDVDATVRAALANTDITKGFKAHAELGGFERWGSDVMAMSAEISRRAGMPLYIHFGQLWPSPGDPSPVHPDSILADVVPMLKAGDILAHPFSRHPGGVVSADGKLHPFMTLARDMGLKVDVGHGSHFSFQCARIVLDGGVIPDTLGADMHGYNTLVPAPPGTPKEHSDTEHMFFGKQRFSMASAMTSMLALGLPINHVVAMATCNPVEVFGLPKDLGTLAIGNPADISVLNDERGRFQLKDNEGTAAYSDRLLTPAFCLKDGERFDAVASILPPYSSFAA